MYNIITVNVSSYPRSLWSPPHTPLPSRFPSSSPPAPASSFHRRRPRERQFRTPSSERPRAVPSRRHRISSRSDSSQGTACGTGGSISGSGSSAKRGGGAQNNGGSVVAAAHSVTLVTSWRRRGSSGSVSGGGGSVTARRWWKFGGGKVAVAASAAVAAA